MLYMEILFYLAIFFILVALRDIFNYLHKLETLISNRGNSNSEDDNENLNVCGNCKNWNCEGYQHYCKSTGEVVARNRFETCDKWEKGEREL